MLQIYKASAGSGKTFTLAKEYLKLLLGRKDSQGRYHLHKASDYGFGKPKAHSHILAVTFTNKATEEMTARIVKELAVLAHPFLFSDKKSPYLDDFMKAFGADEGAISEAAKRALLDLLFNFNSFSVSTIDSFFQTVLRIFTRELDLPADYELQLDNSYPVTVGVGNMLQSINPPGSVMGARIVDDTEEERAKRLWLVDWLQKFVMHKVGENQQFNLFAKSSDLNRSLIGLINSLLNEEYKGFAKQLADYFSDPQRIKNFEKGIASHNAALIDKIARDAAEILSSTPDDVLSANCKRLLGKCADKDLGDKPSSTASTIAANPQKAFLAAAVRKGLVDEVMEAQAQGVAQKYLEYFEHMALVKTVSSYVYILGLFSVSLSHIEEYCRDNNIFLLSNTNDLLRDIINEDEAPFIYERIGTNIRHFLVDEFQDTSRMQWGNMEPLFMESLSHANDNLVIGDEKQCIYRFRNSAPEILGKEVEATVEGRYGKDAIDLRGNSLKENTNYRSASEIVRFNNSLFHALASIIDKKGTSEGLNAADTYANIVQRIPDEHANFHGYVKVHFLPVEAAHMPAQESTDPGASQPQPSDPQPSEPQPSEQQGADEDDKTDVGDTYALDRLVEEISRQLDSGYSPSDIAVLVGTHNEGKKVIDRLLKAMDSPDWKHGHIRILSDDALSVGTSSSIRLIVSIMRLLITPQYLPSTRPEDEGKETLNPAFRRARLINSFRMHSYDMTDCVDDDGNPAQRRVVLNEALALALAEDDDDATIQQRIQELLDMDCPSLISIVERIIDRYLPEESKTRDMAFLTAFQDIVVDFSERADVSLRSFLEWWDSKGRHTGLPSPAGIDAITVSTIHQAKGLQYGCVHLPFASTRMVKYHSLYRPSYGWYPLKAEDFPNVAPADVPPYLPLPNSSALSKLSAFKQRITTFAQQQRLDSLNVAYVAFTRAVNELIVYTKPVTKSNARNAEEARDSLGCHIADAIRMMTDEYLNSGCSGLTADRLAFVHPLNVGDPAPCTFIEFGSPTVKKVDTPAKKPEDEETTPFADNLVAYKAYESEVMTLAKADIRKATLDMADPRDRGIFLHAVLSSVRHTSDLRRAFARTAYRFRLSAEEKAENFDVLEKALADKRVRPWFEGYRRVATERSIATYNGIKRPDRVVWLADGSIAIVDYKFGTANPEKYRGQMEQYARLVKASAASGDAPIHAFLWYPLTGQIEQML